MTHPNHLAHTGQHPRRIRAVTIEWTDHDRLRAMTACAAGIALVAAVMSRRGVPRLSLMWPMDQLGFVAPTCGLTRGVVALARADFAEAWRWNPASYVIGLGIVAMAARFGAWVITRRWLHLHLRPTRTVITIAIVLLTALWVRQQAHAELLMSGA